MAAGQLHTRATCNPQQCSYYVALPVCVVGGGTPIHWWAHAGGDVTSSFLSLIVLYLGTVIKTINHLLAGHCLQSKGDELIKIKSWCALCTNHPLHKCENKLAWVQLRRVGWEKGIVDVVVGKEAVEEGAHVVSEMNGSIVDNQQVTTLEAASSHSI